MRAEVMGRAGRHPSLNVDVARWPLRLWIRIDLEFSRETLAGKGRRPVGRPFSVTGAALGRGAGRGLARSGPGRQEAGAAHKSRSRHHTSRYVCSQPRAGPFLQEIQCTPACAGRW